MGVLAFGASVCCKYPDWRLLCGSLRRSLFCHPFQLHCCSSLERNRDLICGEEKSILEKEKKYSKGKSSLEMGMQWESTFPGGLVKIIFINKGLLSAMRFELFFTVIVGSVSQYSFPKSDALPDLWLQRDPLPLASNKFSSFAVLWKQPAHLTLRHFPEAAKFKGSFATNLSVCARALYHSHSTDWRALLLESTSPLSL